MVNSIVKSTPERSLPCTTTRPTCFGSESSPQSLLDKRGVPVLGRSETSKFQSASMYIHSRLRYHPDCHHPSTESMVMLSFGGGWRNAQKPGRGYPPDPGNCADLRSERRRGFADGKRQREPTAAPTCGDYGPAAPGLCQL
ncbi:unnamed protein product [Nesidiocoris tenuis]|uniref:Uncharacterized protein n=1 Tax=Nesidiocoris tenuis TaxID=355587 RepID=A0A6H5FWD9_9HEMI|nr:unnamed protein product [Nesidiocoris tenuis]